MDNVNRRPGIGSDKTATPRLVCLAGAMLLPGGGVLDGSESRDPLNTGDLDSLRAGIVLGKVTASGFYAPSILGVLTAAYTSTSMTVSAATAVEIVRRIGSSGTFKVTGPPSAAGTVATTTITFSAVDTSTGVITITDPGDLDCIAGSFIQPTDGSETPLAILSDGYPIKVTDSDGTTELDVGAANILIGGHLDASQIVNYPSDASLKTWLKVTKLNAVCQFTYDDDF